MVVIEKHDFSAALWLADPNDDFEHNGVVGMASFNPRKGIDLEIPLGSIGRGDSASFSADYHQKYELLYGVGRRGEYITLVNALCRSAECSYPGFPCESWRAQEAIVSHGQPVNPSLRIEKAAVEIDGLLEWCHQNPVKSLTRYDKDIKWLSTEISASAEMLDDVPLYESESMKAYLSPMVSVNHGELPLQAQSLTSDYNLSFQFSGNLPTLSQVIYERIIPFRDFLSLLMGFRAEILSISLLSPDVERPVEVYIPFVEARHCDLSNDAFRHMPFNYPQVRDSLQPMVEKWLSLPGDATRAADIMLGTLANERSIYPALEFIAAASAFEALSRIDHKTEELSREEFDRRLSVVRRSVLDKKTRDWAVYNLQHSNYVAANELADRMLGELRPYSIFITPDLSRFEQEHRDARNAYVHRTEEISKGTVLTGRNLSTHTNAVLFLVWGKLLNLLGISPDSLIEALKSSSFRWSERAEVQHAYSMNGTKV